jgi:hypothetical protein
MRLRFWIWAHNKAEKLWHWIYYKRMLPLGYGGFVMPKAKDGHRYTLLYGKDAIFYDLEGKS